MLPASVADFMFSAKIIIFPMLEVSLCVCVCVKVLQAACVQGGGSLTDSLSVHVKKKQTRQLSFSWCPHCNYCCMFMNTPNKVVLRNTLHNGFRMYLQLFTFSRFYCVIATKPVISAVTLVKCDLFWQIIRNIPEIDEIL